MSGGEPEHGAMDRRTAASLIGGGALFGGVAAAAPALSPPLPWTSEGFILRPGNRIHYVSLGEGEPVVMLHKLGGAVADWRGVAPLIAKAGRRVIAIDLPGHGQSQAFGPPPYVVTVAETTATIRAVLLELGLSRCDVVGNSLGGIVGILMSAFWPDAVSRLGLISVSLIPAMTLAAIHQQDLDRKAEFTPDGAPRPRTIADAAEIGYREPRVLEEDNKTRAQAGVWMRPQERGVGLVGVTEYLPRVTARTLLITGDIGRYVKYQAVARRLLRSVQVVQVEGAGAFVHQEKPAETAAALIPFLSAPPGAA